MFLICLLIQKKYILNLKKKIVFKFNYQEFNIYQLSVLKEREVWAYYDRTVIETSGPRRAIFKRIARLCQLHCYGCFFTI